MAQHICDEKSSLCYLFLCLTNNRKWSKSNTIPSISDLFSQSAKKVTQHNYPIHNNWLAIRQTNLAARRTFILSVSMMGVVCGCINRAPNTKQTNVNDNPFEQSYNLSCTHDGRASNNNAFCVNLSIAFASHLFAYQFMNRTAITSGVVCIRFELLCFSVGLVLRARRGSSSLV